MQRKVADDQTVDALTLILRKDLRNVRLRVPRTRLNTSMSKPTCRAVSAILRVPENGEAFAINIAP